MRYLPIILLLSVGLFALDYYVYRNWRLFVGHRKTPIRWTLPLYRVFMWLMPLSLPLYFQVYRWWEVEPKVIRALFLGFWAIYYVPKLPVALGLLAKDAVRFVIWLFGWFRIRLTGTPAADAPAGSASHSSVGSAAHSPVGSPSRVPGKTTASPDLTDMKRISRAEFMRRMGWSAAAIPFVVTGYSVFRSLYDFSVNHVDIPIAGLPRALDGLRIAQISDLHAGSFFSDRPMWESVSMINELKPDLVAITGDFVNNDVSELSVITPALNALESDLGVFGCLGNHDHYANVRELVPRVKATPVELLVNAHRTIEIDGAKLHVIGTDNTGFRQTYGDLPRAVEGIDSESECAQILLAHDPTFWDSHVRPRFDDIDVMLCGHTHGGQIGFEFGPVRWGLANIVYDRWAGLYAELRQGGASHQFLYVNRGLGTVGPPLRLGIRPEITMLTLRRA